jgi:lipopolysaccharide export system permease protein
LKTIDKYVVREHLGPLAFALATLTSLLLLNYIAKQFGNLVGKGLPWSVIGEFFMLSVPFTIAMTLPMAVLVAALYAFSRLAAENEITALKASGVSMSRVVVPVVALAAVLAGFMIAFNDQVLPRANHRLRKLQSDIARKKPTFALREQVINPVVEGRFYLRAGWIDQSSNGMRDVTIFDLSDPLRRRTIYADSGSMAISEDGRALLLTLHSGYMQELPKNSPGQLQRLFYVKDNIRIEGVGNQLERTWDDGFKSDREMSICEMFREHATAERDHAYAKIELREIVLNDAARSLGRPPVRLEREHRTSLSMASVYCRILQLAGAWNPHPAGPDSLQERTRTASAFQVTSALTSAQAAPGKAPPRPDPIRAGTTPGAALAAPNEQAIARERAASAAETMQYQRVEGAAASALIDGARMRMIEGDRRMDAYGVEIHKKFALSFACIVFVLFGAPIALRFPRGGVGLTIGVSLGVFALYYVGLIAGESLADRGVLPAFWAMWGTNVLFLAISAVLMAGMGREGSTSRGSETSEKFGQFMDRLRGSLRRSRATGAA